MEEVPWESDNPTVPAGRIETAQKAFLNELTHVEDC